MRICNDTDLKSINKLNTEINVFLDYCRESNQKAQQREETLNQTITSLAHDIRTPITSLDGYFQLLGDNPDEEARKRYMECIRNRLDVTVDMLEELFTLAKLQNNMYDLVLDKICINDIVCRAILDFYEDFKLRGIEPYIEVCEETLIVVANDNALNRVLHNILKNILIHGEKSLKVVVDKDEDRVSITISNTYHNSENIDVERVFDRFYMADQARLKDSTGLGLSIAKELMLKMGGSIKARIEKNIFTIELEFIQT